MSIYIAAILSFWSSHLAELASHRPLGLFQAEWVGVARSTREGGHRAPGQVARGKLNVSH